MMEENDFKSLNESSNFIVELLNDNRRIPYRHRKTFIIGFYTPKATVFNVMIGGQDVCTNKTSDNQFIFAINDCYAIPFMKLVYHEVELRPFQQNDIYVIYGKINNQDIIETFLKYPTYCFINDYYFCCHYGMGVTVQLKHDHKEFKLIK